jgi:hypothetical protein
MGEGFVDMRKDLFTYFLFPLPHGKNYLLLSFMSNISQNLYFFLYLEILKSTQSSPPQKKKKTTDEGGSAERYSECHRPNPTAVFFLKGR